MPRCKRIVVPGLPHHVTQRGSRRLPVFFGESDYGDYLQQLRRSTTCHGLVVWAYCLMPNHVHLVVVPPTRRALSLGVGKAHERYSLAINRRHGWTGHLWQERFFSAPMDESHARLALRYVLLNPVRAGLVDRPEAWPFSSARHHLGRTRDPLVGGDPAVEAWQCLLQREENTDFERSIRESTRRGLPLVGEALRQALELEFGRPLSPRPRGRPPEPRSQRPSLVRSSGRDSLPGASS